MLATPSPEILPSATPLASGLLGPEQPVGSLSLPAQLITSLRLTPQQFAQLCEANPEAVLELAADGTLIPMTPTGSDTGARNGELFFQIKAWARASGGWMAFDSSTGFRLPDDSVPPSAPISWLSWRAPAMKAPVASRPCATSWPPTSAMAPASAGC